MLIKTDQLQVGDVFESETFGPHRFMVEKITRLGGLAGTLILARRINDPFQYVHYGEKIEFSIDGALMLKPTREVNMIGRMFVTFSQQAK
jgi:hypothetical protein